MPFGTYVRENQSAFNAAKAANEQRYGQGMNLFNRRIANAGRVFRQAGADAKTRVMNTAAMQHQALANRGLGDTSLSGNIYKGADRELGAELRRIDTQRLMYQNQMLADQAGFIERRTDAYPDPGMAAQLAQGYGRYGAQAGQPVPSQYRQPELPQRQVAPTQSMSRQPSKPATAAVPAAPVVAREFFPNNPPPSAVPAAPLVAERYAAPQRVSAPATPTRGRSYISYGGNEAGNVDLSALNAKYEQDEQPGPTRGEFGGTFGGDPSMTPARRAWLLEGWKPVNRADLNRMHQKVNMTPEEYSYYMAMLGGA